MTLEALARRRQRAEAFAARAYRELLDAVVAEAAIDGANLRDVARRAGIAHATIYNELERRRRALERQED